MTQSYFFYYSFSRNCAKHFLDITPPVIQIKLFIVSARIFFFSYKIVKNLPSFSPTHPVPRCNKKRIRQPQLGKNFCCWVLEIYLHSLAQAQLPTSV